MASSLYQDFTLTPDNCHAEPIHRPLAIGGDGYMFAFDTQSWHLIAVSQGAAELMGYEPAQLWSQPLEKWVPGSLLDELKTGAAIQLVPPEGFEFAGQPYDAIVHTYKGVAFLEFEETVCNEANPAELLRLNARLGSCDDAESLSHEACQFFQDVFGFDRVMVYRFDEDEHGYVLGEAKREQLETYLGLHYPATDIPKVARDLFLLNRTRSIPDIERANRWLEFKPGHKLPDEHLDLSRTQLRATSTIHIEYLRNMGVQATFTVAIVMNDRLWGLFACHHYSPIKPTYSSRVMAELAAQQFVGRLIELNNASERAYLESSQARESKFLHSIEIDDRYQLQAFRGSAELKNLCDCDGAAIVTRGFEPATVGTVPSNASLAKLRDKLAQRGSARIVSYQATNDFPDMGLDAEKIGGILAVRASKISDTTLFWFRLPQRQIVTWAGDQRQPNQFVHSNSDDSIRLSPRASFDKWQQAIGDQSERWESPVLEMIDRLRGSILAKELERTATLVERSNREFMEMTFAAAHDLKEPLRTQLGYLDVLKEDYGAQLGTDALHFLERARVAVHRMQDLTSDLMHYTSLGREPKWELVDLEDLLQEVVRGLELIMGQVGARVESSGLPTLMVDRSRVAQVFRNFVSNALKYVAPGTAPVIKVFTQQTEQALEIRFADNGLGIDEADFDKIFKLYVRLHHRKDHEGTGIGLSIAKRAIESMGGSVGVESTVGQGSTFYMRVSKNLLAE